MFIYYNQLQNFTNPKALTLEETYDASIDTSTSITLNTKTQYIEVSALLKGIFQSVP